MASGINAAVDVNVAITNETKAFLIIIAFISILLIKKRGSVI
jgi:hypothetical protein